MNRASARSVTLPGLSLVLLSAFAACGGARPYAALPIEDDAELTTNVVITDDDVYDVIRVGQAGVERVEGSNQLRVFVPIRNVGDETVQVRVQTSFLDLQKRPIGDDSNQQVQIISPGMTVTHQALSRNEKARDWVMRIGPNN